MRERFHINNGVVMVEHYDYKALEAIRRGDERFKRRRIKSVLQAYPSQIEVGVVYEVDSKPPTPATNNEGSVRDE
jgi:hypothetical protein